MRGAGRWRRRPSAVPAARPPAALQPRVLLPGLEEGAPHPELGQEMRRAPAPALLQEGVSGCFWSFRTTFKEFAEKYGRDQRFRLVQKRKDQEHFFNQFILILKKRDKENRLRLRKMR